MNPASTANPGRGLGLFPRTAFTLLPLTAFAVMLWVLFGQALPISMTWPWVPGLGIELAFRVDGLAALMLLMITGVGSAVFVYTGGYLAARSDQLRAYQLLSLFMIAMIGCVTSDNLLLLFLFWEATSLLSFLLVGFYHERCEARRSAQQALLVTGGGGLVLLAGFIVLGQAMGTYTISAIVQALPATEPTFALQLALALILVGAFTKSAQFPFHFWLPNAMTAPTPVSAYLHSATMVKLGVFLLARLDPGFGEWPMWEWLLKGVGSLTAAWAMLLALRERDLKRILAWSTVATLGTLVVLVGLRGESAPFAVGALLLTHALYKAPLFFVAGIIDHGTGTRLIDAMGGLRRAMPWTAAAALLAGASMAGLPLSFGYVAKDIILDAKNADDVFTFARLAHTFFGIIAVAVAGVVAIRVFWQRPASGQVLPAHESGAAMIAPPLALALVGITLGLFPFVAQDLIRAASDDMQPGTAALALSLALDFDMAATSLLVTLLLGITVYLLWDRLHDALERLARKTGRIGMSSHYERILEGLPRLAAWCTRHLQSGRLPDYVALSLVSVTLALGALLWLQRADLAWPAWQAPGLAVTGGSLLIMAGALAACFLRDRLVLLLATGLVGYGSALLFLYTGAPDVAFTQFTVETVFVIVAATVLLRLKRLGRAQGRPEPVRVGALLLAVAFASVLTIMLLWVLASPFDTTLSDYFAAASVPVAQGRNVVNVILVDFRALDTLGEIAVVMLSLLAALPLLKRLRARRPGQ